MKVTALIVASVFAVAATASTDSYSKVSDAIKKDPSLLQRYCDQPGKPCAHVKNAADKAGSHLTYPDVVNGTDFEECYKEGGKCQKAKRSAEALASAVADAYAAAEPEPRRIIRFCHLVGQPCLKAREAEAISKREASPNPDPRIIRFCHLVGQPCLKAREPEPAANAQPRIIRFCHLVGQPCLKTKRSALPAPEPEANPNPRIIRFCHLVGQPCLKVRSAADEIGSALYRRAADPEPRRIIRFCHLVGQPCLKARDAGETDSDYFDTDKDLIEILDEECNKDGAPCAKAKRAAEDLSFAALQALEQSGLPATPDPRYTPVLDFHPEGDVVFVFTPDPKLGPEDNPDPPHRMRVSSHLLWAASPVFARMFFTKLMEVEGNVFRALDPTEIELEGYLTNWTREILFRIMHFRHVPRTLAIPTIWALAQDVVRFECIPAVTFHLYYWIKEALQTQRTVPELRRLLDVGHCLGREELIELVREPAERAGMTII